ncbi:LapA family protein [Desulfothermobacter acidiphilus]|uniref:LapA family protein n=1 Tax=Desulfothermobacter acidiphilus TaxID=1938353 RepID=UPI003F8C1EE5
MQLIFLLALIFALLVAIFAVQNAIPVSIRFLGWHFSDVSLVLIILGSAVAGALVVFILGVGREWRRTREIRELRAQNLQLSRQLAQSQPPTAGEQTEAPSESEKEQSEGK